MTITINVFNCTPPLTNEWTKVRLVDVSINTVVAKYFADIESTDYTDFIFRSSHFKVFDRITKYYVLLQVIT